MWLLASLFVAVFTLSACGDDDESIFDSYLIGKWHSYKAVVSAQNKSVELDVTKTGKYSQFYYEAVFKSGNKVDMSYYKVDENKASRWQTESGNYSVKDNIVTIYDEEDAIDFFYDSNNKSMYMRVADEVEDIGYTTVFLYFKK